MSAGISSKQSENYWEQKAKSGKFSGFLIQGVSERKQEELGTYRLKKECTILRNVFDRYLVRSSNPLQFLDVGCATGNFIEFFSEWGAVDGFDFSKKYVEICQERFQQSSNISVWYSNILDFKPTKTYDCIFVGGVFYSLLPEDTAKVLKVFYESLSPQGVLILREPVMSKVSKKVESQTDLAVTYRRTCTEFLQEISKEKFEVKKTYLNSAYSSVTIMKKLKIPVLFFENKVIEFLLLDVPLFFARKVRKNMPLDYFFVCKK